MKKFIALDELLANQNPRYAGLNYLIMKLDIFSHAFRQKQLTIDSGIFSLWSVKPVLDIYNTSYLPYKCLLAKRRHRRWVPDVNYKQLTNKRWYWPFWLLIILGIFWQHFCSKFGLGLDRICETSESHIINTDPCIENDAYKNKWRTFLWSAIICVLMHLAAWIFTDE